MTDICLIVVYNFRYDDNIEKIEKIYGNRFNTIYHLVPFYDGSKANVIPVFEHSFYFQGYFPQGLSKYFSEKYSHYVFIADDLILHPKINQNNIVNELNISNNEAFLAKNWGVLSDVTFEWDNFFPALNSFYQDEILEHHEVDWKNELPEMKVAQEYFKQNKLTINKIGIKNFKGYKGDYKYNRFKPSIPKYLKLLLKRRRSLPYPILTGYSDFIVVPASTVKEFCRICEVFRRMRLWVEAAIPTALVLCNNQLVTTTETNYTGTEYWVNKNAYLLAERTKKCDNKINILLNSFGENELYIHPIKLSQWTF